MAVLFLALASVAFALLFLKGWALPLGLVLLARLAFVAVEGDLKRMGPRLPLMVRLALGFHTVLAVGFTLFGIGQLLGIV